MPEPTDARPDPTVEEAAADAVPPSGNAQAAEQARDSYHRQDPGADPGHRPLGREDPTTDGHTAPDAQNVQIR